MTTARRTTSTSRDKVRAHRERQRSRGLRPVQIWVPDVHSAAFVRDARKQSKLVAASTHETANQGFVDAISDWNAG